MIKSTNAEWQFLNSVILLSYEMTLRNLCQPFVFEFVPAVHQRQNILLHLKHVELPPQVVIVSAIPDAII